MNSKKIQVYMRNTNLLMMTSYIFGLYSSMGFVYCMEIWTSPCVCCHIHDPGEKCNIGYFNKLYTRLSGHNRISKCINKIVVGDNDDRICRIKINELHHILRVVVRGALYHNYFPVDIIKNEVVKVKIFHSDYNCLKVIDVDMKEK